MSYTITRVGPFDVYQLPNGHINHIIIRQTGENLQLKTFSMIHALGLQLRYPIYPNIRSLADQVFDETSALYHSNQNKFGSYFVDHFFNSFSIMWRHMRAFGFLNYATATWILACDLVTAWENRNRPNKIHKGTPFYFLGRTFIENGELDIGFNLIYKAIAEDKIYSQNTQQPQSYLKAPAYMYAVLDDDPNNLMYDYVQELRRLIQNYLQNYRTRFSSNLSMADIDQKFLKNSNLEDAVFWFVYLFQYLERRSSIKASLIHLDVYRNDFARLSNLERIFTLCLVIDEVLRGRFRQSYFGGNVIAMARSKNWVTHSVALRTLTDNIGITQQGDTLDPDNWLPSGLASPWVFNGQPLDIGLQCLLIAYGLRNYGGHNLRGQNSLSQRFDEVIERLMFGLFVGIEELP